MEAKGTLALQFLYKLWKKMFASKELKLIKWVKFKVPA